MNAWRTAAKPIGFLPQWDIGRLKEQIEKKRDLVVLDVRQPAEWSAGHIASLLRRITKR
jgi:hydroxyacylglutathione hydrolase